MSDFKSIKTEESNFEERYLNVMQIKNYTGNLKLKKLCHRLKKNLRNISRIKFSRAMHNAHFSRQIVEAEKELEEIKEESEVDKGSTFDKKGSLRKKLSRKNLLRSFSTFEITITKTTKRIRQFVNNIRDGIQGYVSVFSFFGTDGSDKNALGGENKKGTTQVKNIWYLMWCLFTFLLILFQYFFLTYNIFFENFTHFNDDKYEPWVLPILGWPMPKFVNNFNYLTFLAYVFCDVFIFTNFLVHNFRPFYEFLFLIPFDYAFILLSLFLSLFSNSIFRFSQISKFIFLFRINRLGLIFKSFKYSKLFEKYASEKWSPSVVLVMKIFKYIASLLIVTHLVSCFWYFTVVFDVGNQEQMLIMFSEIDNIPNYPKFSIYIFAYYWCFVTMTGYGGTTPAGLLQILFSLMVCLIGCILFVLVVGTVTSIIEEVDEKSSKKKLKLDVIKNYLKFLDLEKADGKLYKTILSYYDFMYKNRSWNEKSILDELPNYLRIEVALFLKKEIVEAVPLFQDSNDNFIAEVVLNLRPRIALPGAVVIKKGDIGREMYFLTKGKVKVVSEDHKTVYATLLSGAYFGEIALTHKSTRNATVIAAEYCDLYILTKDDFEKLELDYPIEFQNIREVAEKRRIQTAKNKK